MVTPPEKILRDLAEDFGRTRNARAVTAPKPLDAPVISRPGY
jgi:hypothetical protein